MCRDGPFRHAPVKGYTREPKRRSSLRTLAPRPAYRWWLDFMARRSPAGGAYFDVS